MKNYFIRDYENKDGSDFYISLKKKYDMADDIFERRFEDFKSDGKRGKTQELETLIGEINAINTTILSNVKTEEDKYKLYKINSLVLGNAYLRLAQCQNEIFEKSRENYNKALGYFNVHIDYLNLDELDLLLMLNKGKYFRNTAEVGKKSSYKRALAIFNDVERHIENVEISNEKKFHLLLDCKINIGRVSRYSYEFEDANKIFLSLILALEMHMDDKVKEKLYHCNSLASLLEKAKSDDIIEKYSHLVKNDEIETYVDEYLLQSLIHIGIIFRKKRDYKKAKEIFNLANHIDKEGENIDAKNNLGVCYRKLGYGQGRMSPEGRELYKKAENIFTELSEKGNKFAEINLYKCKMCCDENECQEVIRELEGNEGRENSFHLQFLLGKFYLRIKDYDNAMECFKKIYQKRGNIALGSLGLKAYYNLAQCKISVGKFRSARKILAEIREAIKKNHNCIDQLTEIDYAWCLMQEGKYHKAQVIYNDLLQEHKDNIDQRQFLMIANNLADCYIHIGQWEKAQEQIDLVLETEEDNSMATYLKGLVLCNQPNPDYQHINRLFDRLIMRKTNELGIYSGWLISAILLYEQNHDERLKENIIERIKYSSNSISMRSYVYLSDFILQIEPNSENLDYHTFCRNFCHIKLIDFGENENFKVLRESLDFHFFEVTDRAFILAHIVKMYSYILKIKERHLFTWKKSKTKIPYHYTKLSTLNCLLIKQNEKNPKLRLWNSIYMNDAYEGKIFDELLNYAVSLKSNLTSDCANDYIERPLSLMNQTDSNVYITSFSTEENSFQMWSIYGDNERGAAIKFDDDFFGIRDEYEDLVLDNKGDEYSLYEVKYFDMDKEKLKSETELLDNLYEIWRHMNAVEMKLEELRRNNTDRDSSFKSAETEVKTFIADRINEIRFLFKTKSYEYEKELRLIQCSHKPEIDNMNFQIPRLYINVERKIENIDVKIGSKLENQQRKDLYVWLKNTKRVNKIEVSDIYKSNNTKENS